MQIKLSAMNGMPDYFKGSPVRPRKPAGKLKEQQSNISRMQANTKQISQKGFAQVRRFGRTPKEAL